MFPVVSRSGAHFVFACLFFACWIGRSNKIQRPKNRETKFALACYFNGFPAGIYLLKVSNENARLMCEICSEIKTPERRQ